MNTFVSFFFLFMRFDGSTSTSNYFSMSIIGYQVINNLKK